MMPRYMLDADTCSYIMKRSHPTLLRRLQAVPVSDVCTSVITKAGRGLAQARPGCRRARGVSPLC